MIRDIFVNMFVIIGLAMTMILFMWALRELIAKVIGCIAKNRCKHRWEFYDCGYTLPYDYETFIVLKCKKCGKIKYIRCDIDTTKWDIEYMGGTD